jgi:hypothetical protein
VTVDILRSWRLPDGSLLVEVADSWEPSFHRMRDGQIVRSYVRTLADDCELMYVHGHRVVDDRLEQVTHVEVGATGRRELISVGETLLEGLIACSDA